MKKWASLLLVILAFYLFAAPAFADQAIWISKETAQQAVAILEKEKFYYDYCAPCEDKFAEKVIIKNVEMIQKSDQDWAVTVNGKDIDLAYTYVKEGKQWVNLAIKLAVEVDSVPDALDGIPVK